jgi:hypothetical protein
MHTIAAGLSGWFTQTSIGSVSVGSIMIYCILEIFKKGKNQDMKRKKRYICHERVFQG